MDDPVPSKSKIGKGNFRVNPQCQYQSLHNNILHNLGKSNLLVVHIKFDIMRTHEHISKDHQWACWCWNVQASHAKKALTSIGNNIVLLLQLVGLTTQDDINARCGRVTVNGVLRIEWGNWKKGLGTEQLRNVFDVTLGNCEE